MTYSRSKSPPKASPDAPPTHSFAIEVVLVVVLVASVCTGVFAALVDRPFKDPTELAQGPGIISTCSRLVHMYTTEMNPEAPPIMRAHCNEQRVEGTAELAGAGVVALGALVGLVIVRERRRRRLQAFADR